MPPLHRPSFVLKAGHAVPAVPVPDLAALTAHRATLATAGTLVAFDSITAAAMPAGPVHFFYSDGLYANWPAVSKLWPPSTTHVDVGITVLAAAASAYDCEPGNGAPQDCPGFWQRSRAAGNRLPIIYCPASWTAEVRAAMAAAKIAPDQYLLWSAHYGIGQHICGSCGYPPADGTQWVDWGSYDESIMGPRFKALWFPKPAPKPPVPPKVTPTPAPTPAPTPTPSTEEDDMFVEAEGPTVGPIGHHVVAGQYYILTGGHRILAAENKNSLGYTQYEAIYGAPKPLNTEAISRWPHT